MDLYVKAFAIGVRGIHKFITLLTDEESWPGNQVVNSGAKSVRRSRSDNNSRGDNPFSKHFVGPRHCGYLDWKNARAYRCSLLAARLYDVVYFGNNISGEDLCDWLAGSSILPGGQTV